MKKFIASAATALLIGGGLALATALPASAHTPTVTADCSTITIDASNYETRPGWNEIVTDAAAYDETVPATYKTVQVEATYETVHHEAETHVVHHDAVTHTEYQYKQLITGKIKWLDSLTWNPGLGWYYTDETREVTDAEAYDETIVDKAAWDEQVVDVPAHEEQVIDVAEHVVHHDAVTHKVHHPADSTPNTVVATVDGDQVLSESFGSSFSDEISLGNQYVAHDYTVTITAWNDPTGSKGWTQTFTGTTVPCDVPVVAPNPGASIAASCGAATITLTNEQADWEANQQASFIVNVDGDFYGAYAVAGDASQDVALTFGEDTGSHEVKVYQAGISEYKLIAEATVESDCAVNVPAQPEPEVTTTSDESTDCEAGTVTTTTTTTTIPYVYDAESNTWILGESEVTTASSERDATAEECPVVTPTPTPTDTAPPVVPAGDDTPSADRLAVTGTDMLGNTLGLVGAAFAVAAVGLGGILYARRRQAHNQ